MAGRSKAVPPRPLCGEGRLQQMLKSRLRLAGPFFCPTNQ